MATKKITELPTANSVANTDLLVTVTSPSGSAATKKITVQNFFGNVSTAVAVNNTATVTGNLTVSAASTFQANLHVNGTLTTNNVIIPTRATPANSTALTIQAGSCFFDNAFIYVATSNNIVKRASLSIF